MAQRSRAMAQQLLAPRQRYGSFRSLLGAPKIGIEKIVDLASCKTLAS